MDLHNVTKTFKVIFTEPVRYTANETYDSIKILSGQTKPSYEEFKEVYDNVVHIIIPFENLRVKRNELLKDTDWTQTNDIRMENEYEWVTYRQALRDLPTNTEDPIDPVWPEPPRVKLKADLQTTTDTQLEKMETRVALLETALTSVYNDINRDWVRYEKVDPKPKNVSIPAEISNYLVKLQWTCALVKEGREVTFQNSGVAKVKEVLDLKNFTVDRSLVDGQDTLERVAVETIKKDDLLNVAVSTVREVSEAILDEGVLKKVDDRLAMLDARLAALENI